MKIPKKVKIISIIILVILIVVALVFYFVNNLRKLSFVSDIIKDEIDISYDISAIATDMPTNEDLTNLITKLNNNVNGMVINGNLNIMQNFRFNEDFILTTKELCCLFNIVNNYNNQEDIIFKELDLTVLSTNINKFDIKVYFEVDKTSLNKELNMNFKNNLLFEIQNLRNANSVSNSSEILSINGKSYESLSQDLKDFISNLNKLDIVNNILKEIRTLFNCNYEFIEQGIKIYA